MAKKYDFIIAGGGTSGIITATKLIEHGASVLILEEGIKSNNLLLSMPAGWIKGCLLYTSDAADDNRCVDLGGSRIKFVHGARARAARGEEEGEERGRELSLIHISEPTRLR